MKKKIKVVLSNNDVYYCTRPWYYFWLNDGWGTKSFIDEDGENIKFGNHWVIYQKAIRVADIPMDKRKYAEGTN